jgi:hypothetical protein
MELTGYLLSSAAQVLLRHTGGRRNSKLRITKVIKPRQTADNRTPNLTGVRKRISPDVRPF